jgi:hypothetical protein
MLDARCGSSAFKKNFALLDQRWRGAVRPA